MCGIAGMLTTGDADRAVRIVESIVDAQRHRGPDAQATKLFKQRDSSIVLGHDRLSIIDLTTSANQPMTDATGKYHLVFNGEIYNYIEIGEELRAKGVVFRTHSDSEVLLEAFKTWNTAAFSKFNGMFAFALLDEAAETLYLVRDRFGVKPLYWHAAEKEIVFASEPGQIADTYKLGPDLNFLGRGLRRSVFEDGSDESQYEGIPCIRPGWFAKLSAKGPAITHQPWYDLRSEVLKTRESLRGLSNEQIIDRITGLVDSAVELRLRADVPVALSLSGGLDSNIICSSLCKSGRTPEAFSYGSAQDQNSEGPIIQRTSERLGIKVHWIDPGEADVMDAYMRTLRAQDEPYVNGSQVAQYLICERVHEAGFKVLLSGQGADESFMGYRKYFPFCMVANAREKKFIKALSFAIQTAGVAWTERRQTAAFWRQRKTFSSADTTSRLNLPRASDSESIRLKAGQQTWERQIEDVTRFSLPTLLRYDDRNGMAHSLEGRLPFMDYRLVELGLALPDELKLRHGFGKWALREAAKNLLPNEIRMTRSKIGFSSREATWIRNGLGEKLRGQLMANWDRVRPYLREGLQPETSFSDSLLISDRSAVPEILTLIWLGMKESADSTGQKKNQLVANS